MKMFSKANSEHLKNYLGGMPRRFLPRIYMLTTHPSSIILSEVYFLPPLLPIISPHAISTQSITSGAMSADDVTIMVKPAYRVLL